MFRKINQKRKGQALLEYAFLIAGIAFIALVAISVFGHKLADQYAIAAGMLPGAHAEDNEAIQGIAFVETTVNGDGNLAGTGVVEGWQDITGVTDVGEMENNVAANGGGNGGVPNEAAWFVGD